MIVLSSSLVILILPITTAILKPAIPLHVPSPIRFWVIGEALPPHPLLPLVHPNKHSSLYHCPSSSLLSFSSCTLLKTSTLTLKSARCLSPRFTLAPSTTRAVTPPSRSTLSPRLVCTVRLCPQVLLLVGSINSSFQLDGRRWY